MAVNDITIDAPPEKVFALLADGRQYAEWVVGAKRIRDVDAVQTHGSDGPSGR